MEIKCLEIVQRIKRRIDYRLNETLCKMEPNYDDSIVGFNKAWEIVSELLDDEVKMYGGD